MKKIFLLLIMFSVITIADQIYDFKLTPYERLIVNATEAWAVDDIEKCVIEKLNYHTDVREFHYTEEDVIEWCERYFEQLDKENKPKK